MGLHYRKKSGPLTFSMSSKGSRTGASAGGCCLDMLLAMSISSPAVVGGVLLILMH